MKTNYRRKFVFLLSLAGLLGLMAMLSSCRTTGSADSSKSGDLMVGVCADYPPLMFHKGDKIMGAEVDFAQLLGKELGRKVHFLEIRWEDQIDALLEDQTDIIMSGMTITDARKVRIAFSDPYVQLGIMPLARVNDVKKYSSMETIFNGDTRIGVKKGSTADVLANQKGRPNAISYIDPTDACWYLINKRIDVYLHDGPGVMWLAAENEADVAVVPLPLTNDKLAWGLRKDDAQLLAAVNGVLAKWKTDGTLNKILAKWLPHWNVKKATSSP